MSVMVVTRAPTSRQTGAAARSTEDPGAGAGCSVVAIGVKDATAPAVALGQREWQAKSTKQKDSKEMAGICEIFAGGECDERAAGKWSGLGMHQCLAWWVKVVEEVDLHGCLRCTCGLAVPSALASWRAICDGSSGNHFVASADPTVSLDDSAVWCP
jgi:hypothetical protein